MEPLKLYRIRDHYISFLHSRDHRVQFNKGSSRPYVGVVLYVSSFRYFVPMESPKPNHANIKPAAHIMRIGSNMGLLGFNNMIPVVDAALVPFDIDAEPDAAYAELLRHQVSYINRHKADVLDHAAKTYAAATTAARGTFYYRICCDFKKLEKASLQFDPAR